jgi:peptide/nickel transport system substrate-binding protein
MSESNYWKRRVSRRSLLGGAGTTALGGAAALIVGCGGGGDSKGDSGSSGGNVVITEAPPKTPKPQASPKSGGTITVGRPLTVLGIDPHQDLTGLDIDTLIYPYLYSWNPGTETAVFNNLAESLEQPDPTEFIFTLRTDVKNADFNFAGAGEALTSEDVKQSFIRRGTSISAPDKRFPRLIGADQTAMAAALKTPDAKTFSFKLGEYFAPALREMSNPTWAIVSAKVLDALGNRSLTQVGYGAGPFTIDTFRGNERITLKKNTNYFLQGKPYLNGETIVVITENSSLLSAFEQGQHDICGAVLTKDEYLDFQSQEDKFVTAKAPSLFYPCVHMKMKPPFDDVRVREAIDISVDRQQIISVIQGGEGQYNGPIQWPQFFWALPQQELQDFYKYDVARAQQLLSDAGYPDGISAKMKLPKITGVSQIADTAALLKDQWAKAKINVTLEEVELGTFIGNVLLPGNFEMTFFPNLPYDEPDRPLSFYSSKGVTGSGNWNNFTNPAFDKLYNDQAKEPDQAKRKQLILDAQRLIIKEHGPQLTLTGGYAYTAHWNYVHPPFELDETPTPGMTFDPNGASTWTEKA